MDSMLPKVEHPAQSQQAPVLVSPVQSIRPNDNEVPSTMNTLNKCIEMVRQPTLHSNNSRPLRSHSGCLGSYCAPIVLAASCAPSVDAPLVSSIDASPLQHQNGLQPPRLETAPELPVISPPAEQTGTATKAVESGVQ